MADVPKCPLCDWVWRPEMETWYVPKRRLLEPDGSRCDSEEFLLADHVMANHLERIETQRALRCFCGMIQSDYIMVFLAHFKQYGGVEEHYRAWQLGVDP